MKEKNLSGVSAIVLAAGSSTRMGTVKPLVRVGGEAMLQRVLSMLRESRADEIVVVLGYAAQQIRDNVALHDARVVINDSYQNGMASSIQAGLANVRPDAEAALIVLADQPFLQPATIDLLIEEYRKKKPEIIVPLYHGFRGNPVLLNRSVFQEMAALSGDMGCRAIFANHTSGILTLPVGDAGILVDLDTAADVERFEQSGTGEVSEKVTLLEHLYNRFNARDMENVLAAMDEDVIWANGMEGGYVHSRAGVRSYWTRQWAMVDPHVEPVGFSDGPDGEVVVEVHQVVRDLGGNLLVDKKVGHVFRIENGLVKRFDIRDAESPAPSR